MIYTASDKRYDTMPYRRCGKSGLDLPAVSLGLWNNFGYEKHHTLTKQEMCRTAFDLGITHFDLANNYGPPAGAAEEAFGDILKTDFKPYRDEMIISSKAGYDMWPGPYGQWGSRKYLIASCDQSLKAHGARLCRYFFIPTASIPIHHWKKPWGRLIRWYVRARRSMWAFSSYSAERTRDRR